MTITDLQPGITPKTITWGGPRGSLVVLDRGLISIRFPSAAAIDERETAELLAVYDEVKRCRDAGSALTPASIDLPF